MTAPADPRRWTAAEARQAIARAAPVALDALCPPGAILVVAPHPDDETLGCGGLIAMAADAGRDVIVAVLTDGAASHPDSRRAPPPRLAAIRRREVREAVSRLSRGRAALHLFDAPDGGLEAHEAEATAWLEAIADAAAAGSVFATWDADPHLDHKAAFRIAQATARRRQCGLHAYPIWALTLEAAADSGWAAECVTLDIEAVIERKRRAFAAHRSQVTGLISDSDGGFRLSPDDLMRHSGRTEPYFLCPTGALEADR